MNEHNLGDFKISTIGDMDDGSGWTLRGQIVGGVGTPEGKRNELGKRWRPSYDRTQTGLGVVPTP